jgi:hypothetical protein
MAARKKKTVVKKKVAPKKSGAKVAKKRVAAKKAAPKKKPVAKPLAAKKKKPAAAKPAPKPAAPVAAPPKPPAAPKPAPLALLPAGTSTAGTVSAADVNLGHVVALRPRTHTGFKPAAFQEAKRALADERYATIEDAARAVAEKATEFSNESGPDPFSKP